LAGRPLPEPPEWLEAFPKWMSKDNLLSEEEVFVALYDFQVNIDFDYACALDRMRMVILFM